MKKTGFLPLRYRFMLTSSLMLLLLLGSLAIVLGGIQARSVRELIREQGLWIARNLAAESRIHLMADNPAVLEMLAEQSAEKFGLLHVVIQDKPGKIVVHTGRPELTGRQFKNAAGPVAGPALEPNIQVLTPETGGRDVMDVTVPIILRNPRIQWGSVGVRLSLEPMYRLIRQAYMVIGVLGGAALLLGGVMSYWAAGRITRPLSFLVDVSMSAARGNLDQAIRIRTFDEVQVLALNFNKMIAEIRLQQTLLREQLAQIRSLQQYSEKVLSTMEDGLLTVDIKGRVTVINPAARRILGVSAGTAVRDLPVWDLVGEKGELAGYLRGILAEPEGSRMQEIRLACRGGDQVILANAGVLEDPAGQPREIIFNLNDVTGIKALETRMRQTRRLADLGTIAAGMAHEIRNPLSAIKTYVAFLPEKINRPGFLEKFQRTVPREIDRLDDLVEAMLTLSRKPIYSFESTDVGSLITHCVGLLDADFRSRNIEIRWTKGGAFPLVLADADQLEKGFLNLMRNAGQAMARGGRLTIEASVEKDWIHICFTDTGPGISSETAKSIFTPFFTTKAGGTGLGLAITHKVITDHNGTIRLGSKEGEGACFKVGLPVSRCSANPAQVRCSTASSSG